MAALTVSDGRWSPKAVGASLGKVQFSVSLPENSMFDGIKSTQRVAVAGQDRSRNDYARSLVAGNLVSPKCQPSSVTVEGGELDVLQGARECLASQKPYVLLEWNRGELGRL